ncbi:MAG: cytochrome c oxidase assembly protein [Pirellulales bacterium]
MNPTFEAFVRSWPFDPWLLAALAASGSIYLRGWLVLRQRDVDRWRLGRLAAFGGGLAATYLALASPIEPFASLLLQVHMVQHLLLMLVAPPLIWLAWPLLPMMRGLPREVRMVWVAPLVRSRALRRVFARLTHPLVAWPVFVAVTWLWHIPRNYELALSSSGWHLLEHACFVVAGLLFWYPVVRPYPIRPQWNEWLLLPYLVLADVQNTLLAAWLCFAGTVIYPHYAAVPRVAGISALVDQATAGVIMWVPGSIALLLPVLWIGVALLSGVPRGRKHQLGVAGSPAAVNSLPILGNPAPPPRFDLLHVSFVGRMLRWRHSRLVAQSLMAVLAAIVILDGLRGPQATPMNLAGVLPWIHWRGVLVLGMLVAGNFFCMACPFTLPRSLARRWLPGGYHWPRWLRNKWLAVALVAVFLWSYEAFALWDSPWLTAWIVIGYFVAALVVDGLFRGAAFCKYVCPIGQFNFVQSLVSPLEVMVREPARCTSCQTKECIRGTSTISGCEMHLFQPRKSGNLDCTFCLDCVKACPHENVGLLAVSPGYALWGDRLRSGIGRFSARPDVAALVALLAFGALANAAGMVEPVVRWQEQLRARLGNPSWLAMTSAYYLVALVLLPVVSLGVVAMTSRAWGSLHQSIPTVATRFTFALVPIGFSMWLAHYSFHLLTSFDTIVPTTQRFVADLGWTGLGAPMWQLACCRPVSGWLTHLQVLMLDVGLLLSLYSGYRIAEQQSPRVSHALRAFVPWAAIVVALFVVGVWIVYQPMQMRGTLEMAG